MEPFSRVFLRFAALISKEFVSLSKSQRLARGRYQTRRLPGPPSWPSVRQRSRTQQYTRNAPTRTKAVQRSFRRNVELQYPLTRATPFHLIDEPPRALPVIEANPLPIQCQSNGAPTRRARRHGVRSHRCISTAGWLVAPPAVRRKKKTGCSLFASHNKGKPSR